MKKKRGKLKENVPKGMTNAGSWDAVSGPLNWWHLLGATKPENGSCRHVETKGNSKGSNETSKENFETRIINTSYLMRDNAIAMYIHASVAAKSNVLIQKE